MTDTRKALPLPPLETFTLDVEGSDKKLTEQTIMARLIGSNSSGQDTHEDHDGDWAPRGFRCSRCRWMEVDIYMDVTHGDKSYPYLVHTVGRSDVPTESDRPRFIPATNPMMVVEALVSRQRSGAHLTVAATMALAQAAGYDDDLKEEMRARRID